MLRRIDSSRRVNMRRPVSYDMFMFDIIDPTRETYIDFSESFCTFYVDWVHKDPLPEFALDMLRQSQHFHWFGAEPGDSPSEIVSVLIAHSIRVLFSLINEKQNSYKVLNALSLDFQEMDMKLKMIERNVIASKYITLVLYGFDEKMYEMIRLFLNTESRIKMDLLICWKIYFVKPPVVQGDITLEDIVSNLKDFVDIKSTI